MSSDALTTWGLRADGGKGVLAYHSRNGVVFTYFFEFGIPSFQNNKCNIIEDQSKGTPFRRKKNREVEPTSPIKSNIVLMSSHHHQMKGKHHKIKY